MIEDVRIPKLGMSTVEVDVLEVLVTPGDDVSAGEGLLEIEGEKTTLVLEAPVSGRVLEVLVNAGATTEVGAVVCRIEVP